MTQADSTEPADTTDALCTALVDGAVVPADLPAPQALALAWALQRTASAAFSSDPGRAVLASAALQRLCDACPPLPELDALAHWTDGIARLTEGRMADAAGLLDASAARWQALGRPAEAAQTQVAKVMALAMLGRHDEAVACGAAAQRALQALGEVAAVSRLSLNLGSLHMRRDDYAAAAGQYREAAVLFARQRLHQPSVMADIGLADALTAQGDFPEAERIYARARMRADHHALPLLQALADESMALLDLARGAFDAALAGLERARRHYERLQLPQNLAIAEKQLADAYLVLRLVPEALALYDHAQARMAALDMPDDRAWTLLQRGRALAALGQGAAAAAALAEAGAQFAAQASDPGLAAVALAQAEQALAAGDAANALAHAALAQATSLHAGLPEGAAHGAALRAAALLQAGDAAAARCLYAQVLGQAQALQLLTLEVRCQTGLGLAALALGDTTSAATALQAAVAQFEQQWRMLPGDDLRSAFLADHLAPYQGLLALALATHAQQADAASAEQVLRRLDDVRARALAQRLQQAPATRRDPTTDALRTRLNWLHRRVQQAADDGAPSPRLTEALRSAERALLEHARRQRLAAPVAAVEDDTGTGSGVSAGDGLDLAALRALLAEDDAIVVYGQQGDELLACVLRRGGVQVHRGLAAWPQVRAVVQALRFQLDALRHGPGALQAHLPLLTQRAQGRLQQLHGLVWAPLVPALAGVRRVLVVPVDALSSVPFAALHDGQQPLASHHVLGQAPSVRVAALGLARPPRPPQRVLALGESSRLPHAGREAEQVAALLPQGQAFTGAAASLATLRDHAAQADVLHLACHAQFRSDNPMFSALHLADGPLSAEAAEQLTLRPGVVVLSACETGLAGQAGGDEQVGLVRAFLVAGAARVLASLWPVDDAITAVMMASFYGALRAGQAPAEALREAQARLRAEHPHPALWAGFVLHGGW